MTAGRPMILYNIGHPWVRSVAREHVPDAFDLRFIDEAVPGAIEALLPEADFLVTGRVPPEWIPLLKRCRLVQKFGVGLDTVDVDGLRRAGIPLATSPTLTPEGVAEHTLTLILVLWKLLIPIHLSVREGGFDMFGRREDIHVVNGKTVGIVGLGRIGRRVAHLAHAFGTEILYADPIPAPPELERQLGARRTSFDEVIERSDVVTAHTPLTEETRQMFGAAEFARMKRGALFINTCRGGTYVLDDLYSALDSGHLGGAGLDVFDPEPPPVDHPLRRLPNVVLTPHNASGTVERHHAIARGQFVNCQRVLDGEVPLHLVEG